MGIPDSWDLTAVSTAHSYYLCSTWSPCGQFVSAAAEGVVEIRDPLTLRVLSTLQSTEVAVKFRHGLAYSPDGRSLVGCSEAAIVIWDTQTGGVIKEIEYRVPGGGLELLWSSDGMIIGAISPRVSETFTVHTYDVVTGTMLSPGTLQSRDQPCVWAHDKSFRIATTTTWDMGCRINIFEVGSALTRVDSFPFRSYSSFGSFSPTTYRASVVSGNRNHDSELLVLDVRNSDVLLREPGTYWRSSFSPDGSFFAAFAGDRLPIWRYKSSGYTRWREFQQTPSPLQFSPTSSSILGRAGALLHVLHLDHSSASSAIKPVVATRSVPRDAYSPHGTYIVTTHRGENTVAITNLRSQNPSSSQFLDAGLKISEIVLTGNVLLVKGPDTVVAWLLTEEGVVDGISGNRKADRNDSLWEISQDTDPQDTPSQGGFWARLLQKDRGKRGGGISGHLEFSVEDGIAAVGNRNGFDIRIYHTRTGEALEPDSATLHHTRTWYRFQNSHRDDCDLYHRNLRKHREPLECDWPVSQTTLREGWVKDSEGKHRLWLHARWRTIGNDVDWLDKVTTLRLKNSSELVIVKF